MQYLRSPRVGDRKQFRDLIAILLLLTAGIGGQFILSDPLKVLVPEVPMLSPADWPGSQYSLELRIIDGRPWSGQRAFVREVVLFNEGVLVSGASQTLVWYAEPAQAAAAWDRQKSLPFWDFPVLASHTGGNQPESLLFCSPPDPYAPPFCSYRAYRGHWYTRVELTGRIADDLLRAELQMLTNRIDQLLKLAPDRP